MSAISSDDQKVCTHCGRCQPIANFKLRSRAQGRRLSWCRDCVNQSARLRTARKRAALLGQTAKYVRMNSDASRVECVVAAACRKVGGIEPFADRLATALKSPNPSVSLSAARLFLSLVVACDQLRTQY